MFIFGKWYPLMAEEGGGEGGDGGNGGGGSGPQITPELQAIIDARVGEAVTGLKTKNSELLGKFKETSEKLKSFEGIDPEAVRGILSKFANDEEAGLIAKGDIETVVNKRVERMKAASDKEVLTAKEEALRYQSRTEKYASRVLKGEVIGAAFDGNIHSLGGSFGYDGELNRTVTVSTAAVTEALRTVYNQPRLLRELGVRR